MKMNPLMLAIGLMASTDTSGQRSDSADAYFQKGVEEKTVKHYQKAAMAFDKALSFDSKFKEAYIENAYVHLAMRQTDKAMLLFNKVLDLESGNAIATKELMELYYNYRQFARAKEMANRCSSCAGAEKIKAMCSYQEEDYGAAIKGLTSYLSKVPTDAEAMYTLARTYLDIEDFKNAVPNYKKAVLLDGEKNVWMYELGLLYYTLEDYQNAVVMFNGAAAKGYPQKSDFQENLGYALMFSGQYEQGEKMLLALLEKKPGNKDMLRDMAEVYYKGKNYDKSLSYCQKLMEMDMKDGKALFQAGLCFQKMGQKDKGQAMCDKAIEYDPSLAGMRQKNMTGF
jgi:tetratricopeptide (TPR) repeat protein